MPTLPSPFVTSHSSTLIQQCVWHERTTFTAFFSGQCSLNFSTTLSIVLVDFLSDASMGASAVYVYTGGSTSYHASVTKIE